MGEKLTAEWCEEMAGWYVTHGSDERLTPSLRIAAAALRWHAASKRATNDTSTTWRTSAETASAALAALAATCEEATSE